MYNMLVAVARIVFAELQDEHWFGFWLSGDMISDFVYVLDLLLHFRIGSFQFE
jgi:hypothetical protein